MNRQIFVRLATKALAQYVGQPPEVQAEAIAREMDYVAELLGETSPRAAAPAPVAEPPRAAFPAPNPAAVATAAPAPSLISTDLRMPAPAERASIASPDPEPVRSLRQPAYRMKVEDLNLLIQQRTPQELTFDVPMEDSSTRSVTFVRNVISMHASDAVQLVYSPPNVTQSAREAVEVQESISIDDLPLDLNVVLAKLKEQAIESVRPRRIPQSVMPPPTAGPVKHAQDTYVDPQAGAVQAVFNSIG